MNNIWFEAIGSVGSLFLLWNVLGLILCTAGLLLEKILRKGNPRMRSSLLRLTLLLALGIPVICSLWDRMHPPLAVFAGSLQELEQADSLPATGLSALTGWFPTAADVSNYNDKISAASNLAEVRMEILYGTALAISCLLSVCLAVRLLFAIVQSVALHGRAKSFQASDSLGQAIAETMGVPVPQVLEVGGIQSPMLFGLLKPSILLPHGFEAGSEVYWHELTHFQRHDLWWQMLARLATILMPLQPGFWLLSDALVRADEDVCDDAVLMHGASRSAYADLLLSVAEAQSSPQPGLCLPMAAFRSQLELRINRLMDTARPLTDRISLPSFGLSMSPLLLVGALAATIYLNAERPLLAADQEPIGTLTETEAKQNGVAAVVNGHTISESEVEREDAATVELVKAKYSGDELNQMIAKSRKAVVSALIDRELIVEEFKAQGGVISKEEADSLLDEAVKRDYKGDRDAMIRDLAQRHLSPDDYRQKVEGAFVVGQMWKKNVMDKEVTRTQDEAKRIQTEWIDGLRAKAQIQTFISS